MYTLEDVFNCCKLCFGRRPVKHKRRIDYGRYGIGVNEYCMRHCAYCNRATRKFVMAMRRISAMDKIRKSGKGDIWKLWRTY